MHEKTVLIVDDEAYLCSILKELLEKRGYFVVVAPTAQEAIARTKTHSPKLILLDKGLPDATGFDALQDIRKFNKTVKVIMVSADPLDRHIEQDIKNLDILDYLVKPITLVELMATVDRALDDRIFL